MNPVFNASEISATQRQQLLVDFNNTQRPYPADICIHRMFEQQVNRTPEHVAVSLNGHELTYRELNARSNKLAHYLSQFGVGPEVLVGVCLERSIEMVIALLGILKAGGAYVPIDPAYPRERQEFMIADSQCDVLLTQSSIADRLPLNSARLILMDNDAPKIAAEAADSIKPEANAENLCYAIYTSGSTGKPKGTLITHRNLVHSTFARFEYYKEPLSSFLLLSSFAFDSSVAGIFWTLCSGGTLAIPVEGMQHSPAQLAGIVKHSHISHLLCLPSLYAAILEHGHGNALASLRVVIVAGEACAPEIVGRHAANAAQANLYNEYGPTEATVWSTVHACRPVPAGESVPIGRPISNTQIFILNEQLHPVAVGQSGEIYIGGEGLARGYLNRPDLTAQRFVRHPFSDTYGARLYKTGDLARYLPSGLIQFLGRVDEQVKIRGFRIELGEIENVLHSHPAILECAVAALDDASGDKKLVAYAVLRPGTALTISSVHDFLKEKLPDFMLPAALVLLDALPLSANGKIDRKALPTPGGKRPELAQAFVAPRDELESFIARIWCEILNLDRVGIHDKFFELGGDSIKGALFISRLQKEIGEFIYIVKLFEAPSIAECVAFLHRDYRAAIARRFGNSVNALIRSSNQPQASASSEPKIDAAMVAQLRRLIPTLPALSIKDNQPKNPAAIFILSPPRSGTTLLRVMLAGHPDLFSATELQLLGFNTLAERRAAFSGKFALWLEGTLRTLMELHHCDADEAKQKMAEYEHQNLSTKEFYRLLQGWLGNRTLVDKSPSYVFDLPTLQKAERDFEGAVYIHLVRHPYAMVCSFEKLHMNQVLYLPDHPFSARQLGELIWLISHQNTLEFLKSVPPERQYRMRYEDLAKSPRASMEAMCQALNIPFNEKLVDPYRDLDRKMTDGIYATSTPMGDETFLKQLRINPTLADSWKKAEDDNFLSQLTWDVARELGYSPPAEKDANDSIDAASVASSAVGRRENINRQKRLREEMRHARGQEQ